MVYLSTLPIGQMAPRSLPSVRSHLVTAFFMISLSWIEEAHTGIIRIIQSSTAMVFEDPSSSTITMIR